MDKILMFHVAFVYSLKYYYVQVAKHWTNLVLKYSNINKILFKNIEQVKVTPCRRRGEVEV